MPKINSNSITFVDITDSRKLEVYITSNLPTIQIYDPNTKIYSPDWSVTNLQLTADVYLDSEKITPQTIQWYTRIDTIETLVGTSPDSSVTANILSDNPIITYICRVTYQNLEAFNEITFMRTDTGVNGSDGTSITILGSYDTLTELQTKHPTGKAGDAYIVDGDLYVWAVNDAEWENVGNIQGPAGQDAKNIVLSGDSQVFKVDANNVTTPATIKVVAKTFNTSAITWTYSVNGGKDFLSTVPTGVSRNGTIVTITGSSLASDSLVIRASDGTVEDIFTVYKSFDGHHGTPGAPAPIAFLTNENITFSANAQGQIASTTIVSNVVAYNGTTKVLPTIGTITGVPEGMTITPSTMNDSKEIVLTITVDDNATLGSDSNNMGVISVPITSPVSIVRHLTWNKVNNGINGFDGKHGEDAYTVMLTNESNVFAGDVSNAIAGTASTQVLAYVGAESKPVTIKSVNGIAASTTDVDTGIAGLQFKCSAISGTSPTITFTCTTAFKSASGLIPIVISVGGVSFTKMFTYSIAFKGTPGNPGTPGTPGAPATSYWLISSASVVQKTSTGTIAVTPSTLTFTGKSKIGTAVPTDYACRWIIAYSTDGTNYTNLYTSTANEASKSITVLTTYKTVRARMYMADGTTTLLDEQIIPVVVDGATGSNGRGITSIVEQYYQSTSATAQSGGSWSATVPTWADGKYIWTRSIITYTDSTTHTTSPICVTGQKGGIGGTGVGVSSVDVWYYQSTSATALSGGSWSTTAPTWSDGKYVWTKTITTYTNSTTDETTAVCITGQKGSTGVGVKSVTEYYLATSSSSGVTISTSGWTTAVQTITLDKKYLWNYEVITYTNDTTSTTAPIIIGVFGNTGKGIKSVTEYYLATSSSSGVTTSTAGWKDTMQTLTPANKYLWNYELITYTDNSTATISPVIIGVYGDQGIQGPKGNDAYTVMLTNESHIFAGDVSNAIAGSTTTQVLTYNGSTAQSVTIVSVNGKTAATADTDTGIAGLKFKCSALSGVSPTITFTCTTSFVSKSGTIPIVLSVGGVQFTKMFTYSIAFKGTTGSPGNPGSPGTPASLVDITPSALYFKSTTGKDGTFTPDYIYLYPRFQTVTYSKWEYSTNGGTTWVAASGANGLAIGTYNSVANTLRVAKTSTLYTDTVTSISFRCVSSNASVYDTVSIAKIYDVVDLQIEGRNLLLNSGIPVTNSTYNIKTYELAIAPIVGETYTITLKGKLGEGKSHFSAYNSGGNVTLAALTKVGTSDLYTKTFTWTNGGRTDLDKSVFIYVMANTTVAESTIEWIKLEKGTLATDWTPAPEDYKSITFQLYAPKGYLLTNDVPTITLETFAYDGSQQITNATFAWYSWNGEAWTAISGATGTSLTLTKTNVFKTGVYKCEMKYNDKVYTATATVEDKTDAYNSLIRVNAKYSPTNRMYWILYATAYSEDGERDALLGPISETAPTGVSTGAYWYKVDSANYTVTLMKYSGTAWAATTDKQELLYDWFLFTDPTDMVTLGAQSKVKIVTASDFSKVCNVQCNISDTNHLLLTMNNQVLNDPSDPIVSAIEPTNPIDGQLWVKIGDNGTYVISIWSEADKKWIISEADSTKKVYVEKPTQYNAGDIWIVNNDYQPVAYKEGIIQKITVDGVEQTVKHLAGTMLKAQYPSQTYKDSDWVEALTYYKEEIDKIKSDLNTYNQFFSFDDSGLTMQAKSKAGAISEFKTKLTNTELGFYQGEDRVAYINNSQLNISKAQINDGLTVAGTLPKLSIGGFSIVQESNGSLSIVANI